MIPGLTAPGGNPFSRLSPFWPVKRQLASIMAHTLAARVAVGAAERRRTTTTTMTSITRPAAETSRTTVAGTTIDGGAAGSADWDVAVKELERAVAAYDALPYFEPEHWYLPLRHCLGEALLRRGEHARAADVFRRDLRSEHPRNRWALGGLRRAARGVADAVVGGVDARAAPEAALEAAPIRGGGGGEETACFEIFP